MKTVKPKISIIIPAYNAENFLNQTLFSCIGQSLKNIEIICVNDCSTDSTSLILDSFAEKDTRVRVIHHETNLGEGLSRKTGISASTGEYIMFLDADDSFTLDACETLYSAISNANVDILQFGTNVITHGNINRAEYDGIITLLAPPCNGIISNVVGGLVNTCFAEHRFGHTVWNKIFRGDIVRHAVNYYADDRFDIGADLYLFFLIAFYSKTYSSIPEKLYNYNFGAGITGGKPLTDKQFLARARVGKLIQNLAFFLDEFDCPKYCEAALLKIKKEQTEAIVYNWYHNGEELSQNLAIERMLTYFDVSDILSEIYFYYINSDNERKKSILSQLEHTKALATSKREVKTIGTFYFRMTNGGIERAMSLLIHLWVRMGYRVILFTDDVPTSSDYQCPANVIRVVVPQILHDEKKEYHHRMACLHDMLTRYEVDLLVYHAWTSETVALDILAVKSAGIPVAVHTHGLFCHGASSPNTKYAYKSMENGRVFKLADAVITITETDYQYWSALHPCVYKTVNPSTFNINETVPSTLDSKNLLYLGRIHPDKKVEDTIRILKAVLDAGCDTQLYIIGSCDYEPYLDSLKNLIVELELQNYVHLHGYKQNVADYYRNSCIYLMTSSFEGAPMTLVECMAFGVPVVTYDLPNVDIVQKKQGVVVVPQHDIHDAAAEIIKLLNNDEYLHEMGIAARKSIEEMYSLDLEAIWKQLFEEIGQKRRQKTGLTHNVKMNTAISVMLDCYLSGVEAREKEYLWAIKTMQPALTQHNDTLPTISAYPGDVVLQMYKDGVMGFDYIFKFLKAYIKFKFSKENRIRRKN